MFSDEGVLHDGLPERERVRRWVDVYALRYAHVVVTHTHIHICTHAHTDTHTCWSSEVSQTLQYRYSDKRLPNWSWQESLGCSCMALPGNKYN